MAKHTKFGRKLIAALSDSVRAIEAGQLAIPRLRMPIRIVLWREDRRWYAMCLELGVTGDGHTQTAALHVLDEAIAATVSFCASQGCHRSVFRPAKPEYFEMFATGDDVNGGQIELEYSWLTLEQPVFRRSILPKQDGGKA